VTAELSAAQRPTTRPPPGDWLVLLSHFDTKSGIHTNFLGANDGGSSTGLLLELARFLREHPPASCNILFGFVDGEECRVNFGPNDGLHGSRRLATRLVAGKRAVRAVILLDMIGDRDLGVTLPSNGSPDLTLLALECARECGAQDSSFRLADGGILDDHQPFLDAGFPAVDLIDFAYGSAPGLNDYWHTPADTLDKLSPASLATVGRVATGMIRHLDANLSGSVQTHARISSRTRQ
jgi:glutaminyl-peptide cyclotransferase